MASAAMLVAGHPGSAPSVHRSEPAAILKDGSDGANWAGYGRTFGEQHYSPLDQVNARNLGDLGLSWSIDLPPGNAVTQPLEVDGVLYFTTGYSVVHAVDAVTGGELWTYDPHAPEAAGERLRRSWGSRGLGYWDGRIYTGTVDGRLIALDARTGTVAWSSQTLEDGDLRYITAAPRIFDGKVIVGHGGADSSDARGYVTAYDARTGEQVWRFFTVPGDPAKGFENAAMAMAAKTWSGEWWKFGGGGTVWNALSYDPETRTVFIGTGNGAPWNRKVRSQGKGDNLFLASILALDVNTGRYKWHYQVNPGETWDYNAAMDMHLANLRIGGKVRKVLVTAPKNGFLYVIDRTNGKFISAEKIAKVTWATRIDPKTGRPVEVAGARYENGQSFELWPSNSGAHSHMPSAFSPQTGLVYVPVAEAGLVFTDAGLDLANWKRTPHAAYDVGAYPAFGPSTKLPDPTSFLVAWNPATQKLAWKVETPKKWNGGLMATAGNLVFQGQADGQFNAYDARTGKRLWSFAAQAPVLAAPISYMVGGRQYITVLAGPGTSAGVDASAIATTSDYRTTQRRVLTFAIGGTATLPRPEPADTTPLDDPDYREDTASATRGARLFGQCFSCHGIGADAGGGVAPDLRRSPIPLSSEAFAAVVHEGALVSQGMPIFPEFSARDMDDLRQYLRSRRADLRSANSQQMRAGS
ncbi:PQQ-dependent dehydrogenase, methanol/ethanol family [Novosphingobium sp. KCTC 2891]|uniref:PQQ-dependent dehydrogenase, methanol/ethanol family n=1 Tax=Novosphingobium sp. KCTC 2891 TaxID=2989730 RepID=UPI0022233859|nr:PQQ-dependent dehydrogenase, methanol/ethanol family [Novosphingobium sp. KCTC 2891]MCW1384891.1 PQQ-dependent dehydrogenase, methanol/ethanol family [Novosphingobium sp. KCTC 2891]